MDHGLHNTAPDPIENSLPLDPNLNLANGLTLVQRKWHTFPEPTVPSGDTTPAHSRTNHTVSTHSDDRYRQKLVESLRQKVQPGILPSTKFLIRIHGYPDKIWLIGCRTFVSKHTLPIFISSSRSSMHPHFSRRSKTRSSYCQCAQLAACFLAHQGH